jgi:hypothetical protein
MKVSFFLFYVLANHSILMGFEVRGLVGLAVRGLMGFI